MMDYSILGIPASRLNILKKQHISFFSKLDWQAGVAFGLPFLLYLLTLAPTIYNLDSAELTTAVGTGGILRATGYPLYLLLGKIWTVIPIGDLGYRMNLFSAFFGALTIFLADRALRRLDVGPWARLGALGLLATAPYFWALSLVAEVYTLHTALMAGIIVSLMVWDQRPSPRWFGLSVLLLVLSMGNHAATVLLIPGWTWFVLSRHPRRLFNPQNLLAGLLAVILGASVFLVLPIRYGANPIFNYAGVYDAAGRFIPVNLQSLTGFMWLVTGRTFSGQMFSYRLPELTVEVMRFGEQLWISFMAIGLAPALVGLVALWRRNRRFAGMLLLFFVANAIFYINYRVVDKETMFLPAYLVWAIWLGYGYQALFSWLKKDPKATLVQRGFLALLVLGVVLGLGWNWRRVDLSGDWSTRQQSELILEQVAPNALIFGWWDTVPAIHYLQYVEGHRPDVTAINRFLISGDDMNAFILSQVQQRPVYINNPAVELLRQTTAEKVGPLYRLYPKE